MANLTPQWWHDPSLFEHQTNSAMVLPKHRERWKYTKPQKAVKLADSLSQPTSAVTAASVETALDLEDQLARAPEVLATLRRLGRLQTITIDRDTELSLTKELLIAPCMIQVHSNCNVKILQSADTSDVSMLFLNLDAGSTVVHHRQAFPVDAAWHYLQVTLGADSNFELHNHAAGAELHRQDIQIDCSGDRSSATLFASAVIEEGLRLDQQITMNHKAVNSTSEQLVRNVLLNNAEVTCNGRIYIGPGASGTDAQLSNKNLALSETVAINTKPELEIYNDDVSCAHGATVGQLDQNAIFYLLSRGVPPDLAKQLVSEAFIAEVTHGEYSEPSMYRFAQALR